MVTVIKEMLPKEQVRAIAGKLFSAKFADGSDSAGPLGQGIKKNQQVSAQSPEYRELAQLVMSTMRQNEAFSVAAIPRRILSPIFASYTPGDKYGRHVDAALMGPYPGMRTDLSMTIALNGPDAYKGGELVLETPFGDQKYKLDAGDAVLYPTHYMHQVMPVTGGRRLAVITWIESMVPDPAQREIIADLAQSMEIMINSEADAEAIRLLEKGRLNLLRMWART